MFYRKIKLLHGFVVVASEDCIVVDQTKTDVSDFAGIVTEKNGTLPHYLVFSDKCISDYTIEEEDGLYAYLGKIYPEVEEVRKQEVKAVFEDGIVVNAEGWKAASRLGLFPIREVKDMDNLYFGTGIIREEI
jgi:hypothetical protein